MARSVPLSRFTSRVGGGSAFFVRLLAMWRYLPILVLLLLPSGCSGYGDIRLKRQVATAELVGVWQLHPNCVTWLSKTGRYSPKPGTTFQIEFRADGTCHYRSLLQNPTTYLDVDGTWRLQTLKDGRSQLNLTLKKGGGYGLPLDFTDIFGHLEIFNYWGDPDACDILRYDKKA